jgi:hypothetical protein
LLALRNFAVALNFTFAELQMVTSLGRGEVRECVRRGIISAPAGVGQGNHRAYSKWNLVQGVIAAALLRHVRAGSVEQLMIRLQLALLARRINPEAYCATPEKFDFGDFALHFPPRAKSDDKADLAFGEDRGEDAFLIATARATRTPQAGPALTSDTQSASFCSLPIDLAGAVQFVNHMIETKLQDP